MNAVKIAYKPVGLVLGMASGAAAGLVFQKVWERLGHEDDAPDATDEDRGWQEILFAAALQGAVFAVVRAAVERGGARTTKRLTGVWPG
ncbi:DUF4235 domain-containing protein [Streptomyces sp. SID8379]|uniref:DUF4235 domain-containing protein n=1 Tax=unclassified Streptomyces TaxID=2593676 RepID=UPI00039C2E6E|nr:DUF4235 domain-containing protein [Streptomyces sp. HmicA12]MYW66911.1 DUF4235 domain-containing protein [Streptomyces sp. SID8379]